MPLTPLGWIVAVAFVGCVVAALVAPARGVFVALAALLALLAFGTLASSPSSRERTEVLSGRDLGAQAAADYEREHGML